MNLNGLDNAYSDFSSGLAIAENVKRTFSIVQSKLQLARILTLKKKFAEAEVILKEQEKEIEKVVRFHSGLSCLIISPGYMKNQESLHLHFNISKVFS